MRRWAAILALGLAACSGPKYPTNAPASRAAPPAPSPPALAPKLAPPPPRSPVPRPEPRVADQCGAAALQRLVGRPRTEIPVPLIPNLQRVACTTCPVTEDFNPARLNFFFDAETGVIKQVRCG